ncbi:MAG: YybH family protein [Gemmatimonadales bacterium]
MLAFYRRALWLALLVAVASCGKNRGSRGQSEAGPAGLSPQDSASVAAVDSAFMAAANAGNVDAMAAVYATDAALLPPNLPLQRGRAAIRRFWSGLLDAYTVTFEIAPDMIEGRGDLAYNLGHYRFSAVPKEKSAPGIADEGKFVEILKKQPDGSWRYVVDIYNSNLAAHR